MTPDRSRLLAAALVGMVLTTAGTVTAVLADGWATWLGWSPVVVFAVALGFLIQQPGSVRGTGLLIGLAVGLVVSAGVCVQTFEAV